MRRHMRSSSKAKEGIKNGLCSQERGEGRRGSSSGRRIAQDATRLAKRRFVRQRSDSRQTDPEVCGNTRSSSSCAAHGHGRCCSREVTRHQSCFSARSRARYSPSIGVVAFRPPVRTLTRPYVPRRYNVRRDSVAINVFSEDEVEVCDEFGSPIPGGWSSGSEWADHEAAQALAGASRIEAQSCGVAVAEIVVLGAIAFVILVLIVLWVLMNVATERPAAGSAA